MIELSDDNKTNQLEAMRNGVNQVMNDAFEPVLMAAANRALAMREEIKAMIEAEVSRQLEARFAGARAYVESVRHTFGEVAVHMSIVSNRPEPKEEIVNHWLDGSRIITDRLGNVLRRENDTPKDAA